MKAIGYIRVSTDEQVEHGSSLDAQRAQILAYAKLYSVEIIGIESDEGLSASTLARPGLQAAFAVLEQGRAEALIVAKLDRLTRSLRDLLDIVQSHFRERYSLLSVAEQLDPRTASGRLVLNILAAVAQWERETTIERTKAVFRHKRERGEYLGGRAPYGWSVGENKVLRSNDCEQRVIFEAKRLREQGASYREVGELLRKNGMYPRQGTCWEAQQVKRICRASN
jgi:DNA invertase Pin-like site-specific DNA recombinase